MVLDVWVDERSVHGRDSDMGMQGLQRRQVQLRVLRRRVSRIVFAIEVVMVAGDDLCADGMMETKTTNGQRGTISKGNGERRKGTHGYLRHRTKHNDEM